MRQIWAALISLALLADPAVGLAEGESSPDLADLADLYCIAADGDQDVTWNRVEQDGFVALRPEQFPNLRLPGARQLRGYSKVIDGVEVRVLTARNNIWGMNAGVTPFHLCWVSASPSTRQPVEQALSRAYHQRGFRQEGARMFMWIPQPDGSNLAISRRDWSRYGQSLPRERGARILLVNDHEGLVAVTYMTAAESCGDWCYGPGENSSGTPLRRQ